MIVATLCGVKLDEQVVDKGSDVEKQLAKKHGAVTFPLLEIDDSTVLTDSHAMAAYLARSNNKEELLGVSDFDQAAVD